MGKFCIASLEKKVAAASIIDAMAKISQMAFCLRAGGGVALESVSVLIMLFPKLVEDELAAPVFTFFEGRLLGFIEK